MLVVLRVKEIPSCSQEGIFIAAILKLITTVENFNFFIQPSFTNFI